MSFKFKARTAVCAAALLVAAGTLVVRAQDATPPAQHDTAAAPVTAAPVDPDAVAAKIGDETITEKDVQVAMKEFASELGQVPAEQRRSATIDALVNMKLLGRAAHDAGLDKGSDFDARMQFVRLQVLRNAYIEQEVVRSLKPEELQKAYQDLVVKLFKPQEEVHARHILVETKEAAEKIIADLKSGKSFEELAKQSKDPSGQNGGDLGFFGKGQMVPPFEAAAFALEPGKTTETPVQTEFGWHVIRVEEKRMSSPPKFEEVEAQLKDHLLKGKYQAVLASLRTKYPVEIVGKPAAPEAAPIGDGATEAAPAEGSAAPAAEAPATEEPAPAN